MWIRKPWLLSLCLLLLLPSWYGFSQSKDLIIKELYKDSIAALAELRVFRDQQESYKEDLRNLKLNLKKKKISEQDFKNQVNILNNNIQNLNVIIENKQQSLIDSQVEVLNLTNQSDGLKIDLSESKTMLKNSELQNKLLKIGLTIVAIIAGGELVYIVLDRI